MAQPTDPPLPPRWADRLLEQFGHPDTVEEVQGDLHELYAYWLRTQGAQAARRRYWWTAVRLLRPFRQTQKPVCSPTHLFSPTMIRSYFKIAFRNLARNRVYSFINISGLAVGMAVAMLIGLWVYDELSFDTYHQQYGRIARIMQHGTVNNETFSGPSLPYPLATELTTNYGSHFRHVLRAWAIEDHTLAAGDQKLTQTGEFIESGAPEMLTLHMLKGNWSGLKEPNSILLSASAARALFGEDDPMGKLMKIDNLMDAKVTGVYEDLPHNTHFHPVKFFAPWDLWVSSKRWIKDQGWDNNFIETYAEIQPATTFDRVSAAIKDSKLKKLGAMKDQAAYHPQVFLHPMEKWHLYSDWKNGRNTGGLIQFVWLFTIIGAFVLLLACINFMNLSTARSEKRAREVGIRKAIGSVRGQLIYQFFSESLLVVMLAFGLSLFLVILSLGWFNQLADKELTILWSNPYFWLASLSFIFLTGLLAGSYPALYLSSFQPIKVLKGTFRVGRFAATPRKVLVVIQFTVSVMLIIGTLIVYRQIQHAKDRPVGYTRDGLLMIPMTSPDFYGKYDLLRTELKNTGVVTEMAESASQVTEIWSANGGFEWKDKDPAVQTDFGTLTVTPEYGKTVGWQFIAGRDFSREFASDSSGLVVNEAAVRYMGFKNPVGEIVRWNMVGKNFRILGVIKDMVMESPFDPPQPTIFRLEGPIRWITIKINPGASAGEALPKIESVFKKLIPSVPFNYKFVDQEYTLKFANEERIGKLATVFAGLAIIISCLGLFGLASFMAEQRTKEIGIRKVLGASVFNLWRLLSKDFILLVILAFFIAAPAAWYLLNNWLQKYEYRTDISWWIFAATGIGALAITLLTVSFQSLKAALTNPVKSLRAD